MGKDRLDGTKKRGFLFELYTLPGRIVLWIMYMFPGVGYSKTRATARHARSPIMTFIYSTIIWFIIFYLLFIDPTIISQISSGE